MKNNRYEKNSHSADTVKIFVENEENWEDGCRRNTDGTVTRFDRIYAEGLHRIDGEDMDVFFGKLFGDWAQESLNKIGSGTYPLIGMIMIEPEETMCIEFLVCTGVLSPDGEAANYMQEEEPVEEDPGKELKSPKDNGKDRTAQEEPVDKSPSMEAQTDPGAEASAGGVVDWKVVREMLSDMDCLMGMFYAARQMILLTEKGLINPEQRDYSLSLYSNNGAEIVNKWEAYRKKKN